MLYKVFNMRDVKYKKTVVLMDRDVVVLIKRVVKDEGKYSFSQKVIKNRFSSTSFFNFLKRIFINPEDDLIKKEFDMAHKWADKQIEILKQKEIF